jgi:DegV family protein with EDD domain
MAERKVLVFTDAAADLPSIEELKTRYNIGPIPQIPLAVNFGEHSFEVGINIDSKLFSDLVSNSNTIPKTSALSSERFLDQYKKQAQDGLDILSVHIGDNLSEVGNQARSAAKEIKSSRVTVYNTGTVSMAQGFLAIEAERAAAAGLNLEQIISILDNKKDRCFLRAVTPNLPYLRASGRASHIQEVLGSILKMNPILQIDRGKVDNVAKPRTGRKAIDWLVNFANENQTIEQIAILDFEAQKDADDLTARLVKEAKIPEDIIYRGILGPVTASHGGPGTFVMVAVRSGQNFFF